MITADFKILNMHCACCTMNIDGELEDTPGIKSSSTSYAKMITRVEFEESRITAGQIVALIKKIGYEAAVCAPHK